MSTKSVSSDRQQSEAKTEGDEAIIALSVAGEVTDTSIVEVGRSRPQFQYSREELMNMKTQPLSKLRPECLDSAYNNSRGVWDPERWHLDRKRSETPPEDERNGRGDQVPDNHSKRRSGDFRERIRKEQDGIVLSPQRRNFNSGCFVNVSQLPNRRPESPINKPEVREKFEVGHREPVRRIGSGRILTRDVWEFRPDTEKLEPDRTDFSFRAGATGGGSIRERDVRDNRDVARDREGLRDRERDNMRDRDDRNERYERRSFGRDFADRDRDRDWDRVDRNDRHDRNHQMDRDKDRGRDRRFLHDRRRTFSDNREIDEPEWFSSGPTSQHDTIELRGFEDIPEEKATNNNTKGKKQSPAQKKRGKRNALDKEEKPSESTSGPKGRSTPTPTDQPANLAPAPHSPISEQNEPPSSPAVKKAEEIENTVVPSPAATEPSTSTNKVQNDTQSNFNLDDFLKSDTFPSVHGLLTNGVGTSAGSGSRFSQWFKRESPNQQLESRRASIQDELLNNLLNDITEPNIQIPSVTESNAYFAPISPANTTNNTTPTTGVKLLEMLQRGNKATQNGQGDAATTIVPMMKNSSIKDIEVGGKVIHSLEELEARMRGGTTLPTATAEPPRVTKSDEDLSAFKKLLAQVTGGQAVPAANGPISQKSQPITLMQLLNKTQQHVAAQQQLAEQMHASNLHHTGPLGPTQHPHQAQMQHENLMKVLQIQQQQKQRQQQQTDMLSMMMGGQRILGVSPLPPEMQLMVNNAPSSRELLQRPEAQAIIQGLQQGEITQQHLIQQLQNPAMQHRHREVLVNVLKMYSGGPPRTTSPHPTAPTPQDHILQQMLYQQQQQQQQRIPSPMNNATYCPAPMISPNLAASPNTLTVQQVHPVIPHRVPSPRELTMHAQSIIQNALIKKKLEEQRENFRKRQEQLQQQQQSQRIGSPINSPAKQQLSPTPLAFTPTSVLRKMTAEKEPEGVGSSDPTKLGNQIQPPHIQQAQSAVQLITQGVLPRHNTLRPQSVQPSWSGPTIKQHPGRPIVKGGGGGGGGSGGSGNQYQYSGNVDYQQQQAQQRVGMGTYGNLARSKHTMTTPLSHVPNTAQYNMPPNWLMGQRSNSITNQLKPQPVPSHLSNIQQQRTVNPQLQQHNINQNYNAPRTDGRPMRAQPISMPVGRQTSPSLGFMSSNGGDLSPTSNQLARWFSPELLAQARAGKLPELGQTNVVSLEELERHQHASTTVHN